MSVTDDIFEDDFDDDDEDIDTQFCAECLQPLGVIDDDLVCENEDCAMFEEPQ